MIRLTVPSIEEDDLLAVREALASGFLVQGARVAAFEQALAERVGAAHAVAVSSGTAALHIALVALGVGPGDLVLTTAYSWIATANVIELAGAEPVFVDIDPSTLNLAPDRLAEAIDRLDASGSLRRVKAILPVHAFGQPADMTSIGALADAHGIPVVEDAACALGAAWEGRPAGSWGRCGCFSFHPRKAITTGEGGLAVTDDAELARTMRALRNHGLDPEASRPDFVRAGFNYRLTEAQAALGSSQLRKLDRILAARRTRAAAYDHALAGTAVAVPGVARGADPVWQAYVVLLPDAVDADPAEIAARRDGVIRGLRERGVETAIGTCHMPLTRHYRSRYGHRWGDFPMTDRVSACALALPLYESLGNDEQRFVVEALRSVLEETPAPAGGGR